MYKKLKATVLSHYGSDRDIALRSWVSTDKGEDRSDEDVDKVLKFLVANGHTKPLERVIFSLDLELDIATDRQLATHRLVTGSIALSHRYTDAKPEFYIPANLSQDAKVLYEASIKYSIQSYDYIYAQAIADGFPAKRAREIARFVLPVGIMTHRQLDVNLLSLANIFRLRLDLHSQEEIRNLIYQVYEQVMGISELSTITKLLDAKNWEI